MRKLIFFLLLTVSAIRVYADGKATFTAEAPDVVVSGDQFRVEFTVNTTDVSNFRAPSIKGFDVLMGPARSQRSSTQIINGKVSSSSSITYTFTLMADKAGTYTIPAASIDVDNKKIFSNSVTIKVLPPDQNGGNNGNNGSSSSSRAQIAGSRITDKDLFMTVTASKTTVHEQEAILLTYKVYTLVNLRQLPFKMPDLKGFLTQEVDLPQQKTYTMEHYKGRNYNTILWLSLIHI